MQFDKSIIESESYRLIQSNIPDHLKKLASLCLDVFKDKHTVCTKELSTPILKLRGKYGYKWPTLVELHKFLFPGKEIVQEHTALSDVRILVDCFDGLRGKVEKIKELR